MSEINKTLCVSIQRKGSINQCIRKPKENSEYCGIHKRMKTPIRYEDILKKNTKMVNEIKLSSLFYDPNRIYSKSDFYEKPKTYFKLNILRRTINRLNLNSLIDPIQNKYILINKIKSYFIKYDYYSDNVKSIIKVQSMFRKYLIRKRKYTVNDTDFFTMENKYTIPLHYYYSYKTFNGFTYCFDIRSLNKMIEINENSNITNPYNQMFIPSFIINDINNKISDLKIKNIPVLFKCDKLTPEQEFNSYVLDVFQKIDMLGNYTDCGWFYNLNMSQLIKLYVEAEDIWNYRTQLSPSKKIDIVQDGNIFTIPIHVINELTVKHKRELQILLLHIFNSLVTKGKTIDDKKLGAMIVLTSLTIVSKDAADAMPWYVQNF